MTDPQIPEEPEALSRPQRRLLRRLFNGRTVAIVADEREFMTFQAAKAYLLGLEPERREAVYQEMKTQG